jgi:hypothetical protein
MPVAAERARMDPTDLSDAQLDQLADQLAGRLPSGTHGDRVVLSRRAFAAAVGGTLGASGLVALGVDPAAAQAAGQVGTSADPVDARLFDLYVANALQSDLDAGGNALTNVGSLSTEIAEITKQTDGNARHFLVGIRETSPLGFTDILEFDHNGRTNKYVAVSLRGWVVEGGVGASRSYDVLDVANGIDDNWGSSGSDLLTGDGWRVRVGSDNSKAYLQINLDQSFPDGFLLISTACKEDIIRVY